MLEIEALFQIFLLQHPIFINEADLVNQFACFLHVHGMLELHFEYCVNNVPHNIAHDNSISIDLMCIDANGNIYLIEFKYKTDRLTHTFNGLTYHLKRQGAVSHGLFDVINDMVRVEYLQNRIAQDFETENVNAYAIFVTNEHLYLIDRSHDHRVQTQFLSLHEGRELHHDVAYGYNNANVAGVGLFRLNNPNILHQNHIIHWTHYYTANGNPHTADNNPQFYYTIFTSN